MIIVELKILASNLKALSGIVLVPSPTAHIIIWVENSFYEQRIIVFILSIHTLVSIIPFITHRANSLYMHIIILYTVPISIAGYAYQQVRPLLGGGIVWTDPVKPPSFLGSLFSRHKLETCQSFLLDPSALTFLFLLDPQTFLLDSAPHQCNV